MPVRKSHVGKKAGAVKNENAFAVHVTKQAPTTGNSSSPEFAEIIVTEDPTIFTVKHGSDAAFYNEVNKRLLQPIPRPGDPGNLVLTLAEVLGASGAAIESSIIKGGQIVFHAGGDTGPIKGPQNVSMVVDKMTNDFVNEPAGEVPAFFFHLGDVVYSFGEAKYYYDQFYDPFRNYPGPILAIPGNHDGLVYQGDPTPSLEPFLRNFVSQYPVQTPEAGGLIRTAMIQPGVYFSFDAPFVTLIGLYSNVLEDPGVISSEGNKSSPVTDEQLDFLIHELTRVKNSGNAVLVCLHHPPYAWGGNHGGSHKLLADLDGCCKKARFWPHAFISGHAHSYQRFTRNIKNYDVPYIICGNSGHNVTGFISTKSTALRAPIQLSNDLRFENYDDKNYGYLRIMCNKMILRVEYHDATPGQKTYSDAVTVDLKSHRMISN